MTKPLIYIAGPITLGNPMHSTHRAIEIAELVVEAGAVPHVPHLSIFWDTIHPHDWKYWLDMDMHIIDHCDALIRFSGLSKGADVEVDHARSRGMPVFVASDYPSLDEMIVSVREWVGGLSVVPACYSDQ